MRQLKDEENIEKLLFRKKQRRTIELIGFLYKMNLF